MKRLVLVDGMYEVCRAEKAMGHLSTSDGRRSGMLYGFLRAFRSYWKRFGAVPVVVWDGSSKERRKLIPDYKKDSRVEDLSVKQIDDAKKMLSALGVVQVRHPDWEADDVMGTLANLFWGEVSIVTGDHDLFQLVDERITCYAPVGAKNRKQTVDEFWVKLNYQVPPSKLPILWALSGDPSDNVKGIEGIGAKTAASVIQEGDPDVLVGEQRERFHTNLKVLVIRKHLEGLEWTWPERDWNALVGLFKGYEFNSFMVEDGKFDLIFVEAGEHLGVLKELAQ